MEWYTYLKDCTPGRVFNHYKGGLYEFICLAEVEPDVEPMVVYKSVAFGTYKVTPISRFFGKIDNGEPRFI